MQAKILQQRLRSDGGQTGLNLFSNQPPSADSAEAAGSALILAEVPSAGMKAALQSRGRL